MNKSLFRSVLRAAIPALALCLVTLLGRAALAANEFVPFDEAARQRTNPNPFILAAYGAIWVAVLGYVAFIARGLAQTRAEIADLRKKVDGAGAKR
jgi:CcmD family protein